MVPYVISPCIAGPSLTPLHIVIALPFLVLGYGYFYHFYQTSAQEVRRFLFLPLNS